MCGIAGLKRMGKDSEPINIVQVQTLLMKIQHRGGDASGIAIQREDGTVVVYKAPTIAWKFLAEEETRKFLEEQLPGAMTVLLHTRLATLGEPRFNENNHPVFAGKVAVTHNGMIQNHWDLFRDMKLERKAKVDTDVIRAILDEHGLTREGIKQLGRMRGSAAIAAVSPEQPDVLLLSRVGSPLVMGMLENSSQLIWASEKEAIHAASRQWVKKWGMSFKANRADLKINTVEKEAAMIITGEGCKWYATYEGNGVRSQVVYNIHRDWERKQLERRREENKETVEEAKKQQGAEAEAEERKGNPDFVICQHCHGTVVLDTKELHEAALWEIECGHCRKLLGERGN